MEAYFPYIAILMTLGIASLLGLLAAKGGYVARWVGAGLLVWWVLWVGEIVIWKTYPEWLYTPEERVYMARLNDAVLDGKQRVTLNDVLPFGTGDVCYVTIGADGVSDTGKAELRRAMGEDVSFHTGWHILDSISVEYVEPFFVMKRNGQIVIIRDLSGVGIAAPSGGSRYWLELELDGKAWGDPYPFFCGARERMRMRFWKV